jgi:benzoylformate decarboxylase
MPGRRCCRRLSRPTDLIVVFGAPVFTFHVEGRAGIFESGTQIWQLTDNPNDAAVAPVGTSILCSMRPALAGLLEALGKTDRDPPPGRAAAAAPKASEPITAEYLLHMIAEALPPDAIVVEEAPSHRPAMQRHFPMRGQDSFYTMSSGGLGFSLPAAVGISMARPGNRVVCLLGDGSAMYSIQALWTAAQHALPITFVILNNAGYGAMRSFSRIMEVENPPGIDLPGIDFVQIARGPRVRGVAGHEACRHLTGTRESLGGGRPGSPRRFPRSGHSRSVSRRRQRPVVSQPSEVEPEQSTVGSSKLAGLSWKDSGS